MHSIFCISFILRKPRREVDPPAVTQQWWSQEWAHPDPLPYAKSHVLTERNKGDCGSSRSLFFFLLTQHTRRRRVLSPAWRPKPSDPFAHLTLIHPSVGAISAPISLRGLGLREGACPVAGCPAGKERKPIPVAYFLLHLPPTPPPPH